MIACGDTISFDSLLAEVVMRDTLTGGAVLRSEAASLPLAGGPANVCDGQPTLQLLAQCIIYPSKRLRLAAINPVSPEPFVTCANEATGLEDLIRRAICYDDAGNVALRVIINGPSDKALLGCETTDSPLETLARQVLVVNFGAGDVALVVHEVATPPEEYTCDDTLPPLQTLLRSLFCEQGVNITTA